MVHNANVIACLSYSSTPGDGIKMDSKQFIFINGLYIQRVTKWAKTYPLIGQSVVFSFGVVSRLFSGVLCVR